MPHDRFVRLSSSTKRMWPTRRTKPTATSARHAIGNLCVKNREWERTNGAGLRVIHCLTSVSVMPAGAGGVLPAAAWATKDRHTWKAMVLRCPWSPRAPSTILMDFYAGKVQQDRDERRHDTNTITVTAEVGPSFR